HRGGGGTVTDEHGERAIGRVVGTEARPNTPHQFHFWTPAGSSVGIGTLVRVAVAEPRPVAIYGIVVDGAAWTDLQTPLHDYLAFEGEPAPDRDAPTARPEVRVYTAATLRHDPAEPLQPVPAGPVFLASHADVRFALRMDAYVHAEGGGLPLGLYGAGGQDAPVYLDAEFLLGPEAAHLNITGVSGLATKTSLILFLLRSIFQHYRGLAAPEGGVGREAVGEAAPEGAAADGAPSPRRGSVAALCFNVKGPDLLFLDQAAELSEEDRAMYGKLGVDPVPFEDVSYYAPYRPDGYNLNTLRTNEALAGNVQPLVWGLEQILKFAEVLLTRDDIDAKADALIEFIRERVVGREFGGGGETLHRHNVRTFQELEAWFEDVLSMCEQNDRTQWRTHHVATIRKVRNRLLNLTTRAKGLVSNDEAVSDLPWGEFRDRGVYVLDVANVEPEAQDLIFARVVTEARERLERGELGVDHLVVFVDELNKYAPADAQDSYVRRMLLDISERGRYLGLLLFSAQQFRSQVHKRVVGNSGTALFGRMDMDELATPGYQVLSGATKAKLASLPKGELMVRHPHFTQPVFVRFPRPPVLLGREGTRRFPHAPDLPFEDAVARHLRRLDRAISAAEVKDMIAGREEEEVLRALHRTQQVRPEEPLAFFRACLKKRPQREVAGPAAGWSGSGGGRVVVPDDPYGP
ncbi:MAG TPA: hypothetical protein VMK65_12615, partial [Longimicrobiales bacterium]|nr:hypothetical protein [Longimicrobiales bacterium]